MIPSEPFLRAAPAPLRPPPPAHSISWASGLFGTMASSAATVALAAALLWVGAIFLEWAVLTGVWNGDGATCRDAGACWAFLREKSPLILFGIYPPDERWRPMLMIALILAATLWSMPRRNWQLSTLGLWGGTVIASLWLMGGGAGLTSVPTSAWGGLPVTLLLTILSLLIGFPLAVALALGRQSELPVLRWLSIGTIEVVRALPLLSILFVVSVLLPIMLPEGISIDKLLRALAALVIGSAVYIAEVIRGGLQSIPRGQAEASHALGLSWWQMMQKIILPQAIGTVIPPLTNTVVVIVKNTSLVLVVGLFDLLSAGRAALADGDWPAPFVETYLFIALVYFLICFSISRYAAWLERDLAKDTHR